MLVELDFGQTQSKESIINFVNSIKKQTKVRPNTEISGGNSVVARIKNIVALTQERLGKYKNDYILIQDKSTLCSYIDRAVLNGSIAIDTETTGLNPISDKLVGVCIYTPDMPAAYIPINHIGYVSEARLDNQLTEAEVADELQRCLGIDCIFFNAKFDIRVMKNHLNLVFKPAWDGFIAAKVLNELEEENNLKYLHKKYCGNIEDAHYTFEKMFKGLNFALVPPDTAYLYAAHDAVITYELYGYQKHLLDKDDELCEQNGYEKLAFVYHNIELPLISVVANMEENGISLDREFAKQLSEKYNLKLREIESRFYHECEKFQKTIADYRKAHKNCKLSDPININSPAQIAILLYDILNYKSISKKDPRGTGESILAEFKTPLTEVVLEYREIAKLLSTYIDKLPNEINPKTGRVHASFNQMGAACVSGETLIPTVNGVFRIDELMQDCVDYQTYYSYEVSIFNKNQESEKTSHCIKYRGVDVITVKTRHGFELTGTYNHPIMSSGYFTEDTLKNHSKKFFREFWQKRRFVQLQDLKVGEYIEVPCNYAHLFPAEYVNTELVPCQKRTHNSIKINVPDVYNELFAEFLGMYHADGSYKTSNGSFVVQISNGDPDIASRVNELVQQLFGIDTHYYPDKRMSTGNTIFSNSGLFGLKRVLCKGAVNKKIPSEIYKSPISVINAYIKGMTLDSSITLTRGIKINVMNKDDAHFIQMTLCAQGIFAGVQERINNRNRSIFYCVHIPVDYAMDFLDKVGFVQSKKTEMCKNMKSPVSHVRRIDNSFRVPVVSITFSKSDVYDFVVPETHSFISSALISHNTGRFSCLPAGTMINLVGEQKPIEDVKVGDLVYCYDDDGNLRIRRVTRTWDIGERPCLDIKWQSSGNGRIGHLICTENHQIKTKSKGWVCAKDLKRYDKLYHLTSKIQKNGRVRLYGTDNFEELEEQFIKREYFNASSDMHIHHIDENKAHNKMECDPAVQSVTPCGVKHVYDLQVEDFHNFIANEICVHNSSDPNLQNIPAHNKEVRRMFTASNNKVLETSEDTLTFFSNDIVPTLRGDIKAVELTVDDVILGEDGKCSVVFIDIDENLVKIQIKEEKCM